MKKLAVLLGFLICGSAFADFDVDKIQNRNFSCENGATVVFKSKGGGFTYTAAATDGNEEQKPVTVSYFFGAGSNRGVLVDARTKDAYEMGSFDFIGETGVFQLEAGFVNTFCSLAKDER